MICSKCKNNFEEKYLECSHDIPKYIGGTDLDGRHWLCKSCHDKYERMILSRCFAIVYSRLIKFPIGRIDLIPFMTTIKKEKDSIKREKFLEIAKKVKEEFYGESISEI